MRLLAAILALCACSSTRDVTHALDAKAERDVVASAVREEGPVTTVVEEWEEEPGQAPPDATKRVAPAAPASPAPHVLLHRRTTTTQQPLSVAGPAVRVAAQATASEVATTKVRDASHTASRPSLGFQLWLVLIPAALVAAGLLAWRVRKWISPL